MAVLGHLENDFLCSYGSLIDLKTAGEPTDLRNHVVGVDGLCRTVRFGVEATSYEGSQSYFADHSTELVCPDDACRQQVRAPAFTASRGARVRDAIVCHHFGATKVD